MTIIFGPLKDQKTYLMPDPRGIICEHKQSLVLWLLNKEEQILLVCLSKNSCTTCLAEHHDLSSFTCCAPRTGESILKKIKAVHCQIGAEADTWAFVAACKDMKLSEVEHPFWEGLDTDICQVIHHDVLHGLHKAFKDHTSQWCTKIIGEFKLDKHLRRFHKQHCICHFHGGISKISQWLGREWKDLERYFFCLHFIMV